MLVLGMVARTRGKLHIAQRLQRAADGGLVERDRELIMKPLDQIDQSPAHHPVDRRDRTLRDDFDQGPVLRIVQPRTGAGGLAVQQSVGATGIEPDHPVPHDLKPDAADPGRRAPAAAVVNLRQRQQPTRRVRAFRPARQSSQRHPVEIIPQADALPMPPPLQSRGTMDLDFSRLGNLP
jgi:hypothetical protein